MTMAIKDKQVKIDHFIVLQNFLFFDKKDTHDTIDLLNDFDDLSLKTTSLRSFFLTNLT
jgi:hypothetical protein